VDFLRVMQKVDIIEENRETNEKFTYLSRIEDIGPKSIFIAPPYRKGFYLPPNVGKVITMWITAESCAYLFNAELLGYSSASVPLWEVALPINVKKIQRRQYVRFDIALDVKIEIEDKPGDPVIALTKNVSAGGVQIVLQEPLPPDSRVKVTLPLTSEATVVATGEVIRVIFPEKPHEKITTAIKFSEIEERARNLIVRYIFRKQAERRQKERALFNED